MAKSRANCSSCVVTSRVRPSGGDTQTALTQVLWSASGSPTGCPVLGSQRSTRPSLLEAIQPPSDHHRPAIIPPSGSVRRPGLDAAVLRAVQEKEMAFAVGLPGRIRVQPDFYFNVGLDKIFLCPATCSVVQADLDARVATAQADANGRVELKGVPAARTLYAARP